MRILTKLKLRFRFDDQTFVSAGNNIMETAPDWIEKDPIFPLAAKDGTLVKLEAATIVQGSGSVKNKESNSEGNGPDVPPETEILDEPAKPAAKKAKK